MSEPNDIPDPGADLRTEELLPAVYAELRSVARDRIGRLPPGQTISATALVHEVWLRMESGSNGGWANRAHFFAAAGTLMRNILVDRARQKGSQKRGGDRQRVELTTRDLSVGASSDLESVHEALEGLEAEDPRAAQLVTLRFFAGMTVEEAAGGTGDLDAHGAAGLRVCQGLVVPCARRGRVLILVRARSRIFVSARSVA